MIRSLLALMIAALCLPALAGLPQEIAPELAPRIVAPPAFVHHVTEPLAASAEGGVAVTIRAEAAGEIELQGIYGKSPFLYDRRSFDKGTHTVRWVLAQMDSLSSVTLALRSTDGTPAMLESIEFADFARLPEADRMRALADQPLQLRAAGRPVANGRIAFVAAVPDALIGEMRSETLVVEFAAGGRIESHEVPVRPALVTEVSGNNKIAFECPAPSLAGNVIAIRLLRRNSGRDIELARLDSVDLVPVPDPYFEVELRSIEDISVTERNGEMALYSVVSREGQTVGRSEAPLFGDLVWLSVFSGNEFVVNERLLRSRRDIDWLAGGPTAINVGREEQHTFGFFTLVTSSGGEGFSFSSAINSLRLSPSSQNPIYTPAPVGDVPSLWRGNVFFSLPNGMLIAGLEMPGGRDPRVRLMTSNSQTRWIDLGIMPLEGLPEDNTWLNGWADDTGYYIMSGPNPRLWRSKDSPLRGWEPMEFQLPDGIIEAAPFRWQDRQWIAILARRNGRGIVTWRPFTISGNTASVAWK